MYRLIEQGLTSPPTQYRLYGRRFYRSKDPPNSIKVLKDDKNTQKKHNRDNKHTHIQKTQQIPWSTLIWGD